jgi:hypothetical protein
MRELGQKSRVGILVRVAVIHAVDAVLAHQYGLGADLEGAQRRGGVGREERVPRAARENDHALLLEMPDRAPAQVRLRDLARRDRRENARVDPELLERVLDGEAVQQGGEHPRVVGSGSVHPLSGHLHPAVDVPRAEDDGGLDSELVNPDDLARDRLDPRAVDAVLLIAEQRLARQLEEDALECGGALLRGCDLAFDLCAHPARA